MASNVELSNEEPNNFIDDPKIDIHTQRPRTPNIPYSNYSETQIKNIKQVRHSFLPIEYHHDIAIFHVSIAE